MTELFRHIGPSPTSPPATSASAGERSASCTVSTNACHNNFAGVLTGKGLPWGGSLIRPEATGYGCVYFAEEMMNQEGGHEGEGLLITGSGNVAQYAVEKLMQLGGKVVTLSDSDGNIYDPGAHERSSPS